MLDAITHCRRGRWCPDRVPVYDDRGRKLPEPAGSPYPGPGGLCDMCSRQALAAVHALAGRDLADLGELAIDPVALDRSERDPSMPRATYQERPIQLDLYADALQRLIVHELAVFAGLVAGPGRADVFYRRPRRLDALARAAGEVLEARWDAVLRLGPCHYTSHGGIRIPDGGDDVSIGATDGSGPMVRRDGGGAAIGFLDLHHRVERACGHGDTTTRHPEPCPGCGKADVMLERAPRQVGDPTTVTCQACAYSVDGDLWHQHTDPGDNWTAALTPTPPQPPTDPQADPPNGANAYLSNGLAPAREA